jgi:uncharacterized protein YggE
MHIIISIVACLALATSLPAAAEIPPGIHVSGRGSLEVEPDMGYVSLHVRREGTSAASLKQEVDGVVGEVLERLGRLQIAERDVTATALSINPRYRRRADEMVVEGLIATRTVNVTLRELDRFGDLLRESLAAGVNNLDPIRLDTSRREELEDEALELAMADAKREAARVAAGFSVTPGPVSDVQVGSHSPRPVLQETAAMAMRADSSMPISPGVIRIERFVQATFAIMAGR